MYHFRYRYLLFVFLVLGWGCSQENNRQTTNKELLNKLNKARLTLPNGWGLSPAGKSIRLGDLPLNTALSSNQKYLAATLNGYGKQGIKLINIQKETVVDSARMNRAWVGLAFSPDNQTLYASGGNDNAIFLFDVQDDRLVRKDSIALGKPFPHDRISPTGLTVDSRNKKLYVVTKDDKSLYQIDLESKSVDKRVKLPAEAYTCLLSNDESELFISIWGGEEVAVYNISRGAITGHISVESHPNDMVLSKNGRYLYVANANANSVSVIDTDQNKPIETLNAALYPDAPTGSTTNSLALSEDGLRLYIANADNNCLAVFDVTEPGQSKSAGYIPTGWYPTSVQIAGNRILVANGKGNHSQANPEGPNPFKRRSSETQYIAGLLTGSLSFIDLPGAADMAAYSQAVYANIPYQPNKHDGEEVGEDNPIPTKPGQDSPIKHVFYVIKENRTYDQVLGDMPEGNGDSTLTIFGRNISPNHHKLASNFVLLDNFYVDAEVSADGHNWSTGAYATDYVEKTWPTYYSGRGGSYNFEGGRDIIYPAKGYIWNYCYRAGVSYRSYGEFAGLNGPSIDVLKGHIAPDYPGFDLGTKDVYREKKWEHDFDSLLAKHAVPQFQTIRFSSDHTSGATTGRPTPDAFVADNDLALGRMIEHLSHSRIWENSVVFVLEDDAQNGPDHVDAHRSVVLVAGPYVKRNAVVHTMYSTSSVLHTIELILGLPPMSQYDAAATPMYDVFTADADTSAYTALANNIDLNKKNMAVNDLSRETDRFNLASADAAPDLELNRVIWKVMKGQDSNMPAPRHSAFLMTSLEEED